MKKIFMGKIAENRQIAKDVFKMVIEGDFGQPKAGQFINIYLEDKSKLLPRPISICDSEGNSITIVYKVTGKGTEQLSQYKTGNSIKVSQPLGNGNYIEGTEKGGVVDNYKGKKVVVCGGGIGVPPMVLLAKKLNEKGGQVIAVLGFQDDVFLVDEFKKYCDEVHIATDSGTAGFHGNVLELIKAKNIIAEEYFSCGPKKMLQALSQFTAEINKPCQVSLEERMGCGYGACVGCMCKIKKEMEKGIKIEQKGVCKHGPVFFGKEVVWNE